MANLAEIAAHAGVSEATVSRVLNDKPGVSERRPRRRADRARRARLRAPARLRRRSAGLVGLVVPELENPIFPAFAQVIDDALAARRFTPVLCTQSPGGISEDEYVESLLDHGVAGILFVSGRHADAARRPGRYQRPDRRRGAVRIGQRLRRRVGAPSSPPTTTRDRDRGRPPGGSSGTSGSAWPSGRRATCRRPARRGLRGGDAPTSFDSTSRRAQRWTRRALFTVEGGAAAATPAASPRGATAIVSGSVRWRSVPIRAVRELGRASPRTSRWRFDDSPLIAVPTRR